MQTWEQNLPEWLRYNTTVDTSLPPGTIELRDEAGKVLGRIENIGQDPAPIEPRFAIALRMRELEVKAATLQEAQIPRPLEAWDEDDGPVLWWSFPVEEPPYSGTPMDDDWPGYHTHWTPLVYPLNPQA